MIGIGCHQISERRVVRPLREPRGDARRFRIEERQSEEIHHHRPAVMLSMNTSSPKGVAVVLW